MMWRFWGGVRFGLGGWFEYYKTKGNSWMRSEKASVIFYKIEQCGFFKYGDKTPMFGDLLTFLENLKDWSNGRSLAQTATYRVREDADLAPSYLFDIKKGTNGSFLLTIWNESDALNGMSASVDPNSSVGSVSVDEKKTKKGNIAGYATYFWFLPSHSLYACIKFSGSIAGNDVMQSYLESFIDPWSEFVSFDIDSNGDAHCVYHDGTGKEYKGLYGRFRSKILRKEGDGNFIIKNHQYIRKVVRRTSLHMKNYVQKGLMDKLIDGMQRAKKVPIRHLPNNTINVNYEMPIEFSRQEIEKLVDEWEKDNSHSRNEWDDYGFKMKGDDKVHWLSRESVRLKIDVKVSRSAPSVVDGLSLISELEGKYSSIKSHLP